MTDDMRREPGHGRIPVCMLTLMTALPISVAPKNVQNGIRKCPQQIPGMERKEEWGEGRMS
jgi:hypothetical protein